MAQYCESDMSAAWDNFNGMMYNDFKNANDFVNTFNGRVQVLVAGGERVSESHKQTVLQRALKPGENAPSDFESFREIVIIQKTTVQDILTGLIEKERRHLRENPLAKVKTDLHALQVTFPWIKKNEDKTPQELRRIYCDDCGGFGHSKGQCASPDGFIVCHLCAGLHS